MKNLLPLLILVYSSAQVNAQKQDNQWYFAFAKAMSFVSGPPTVVTGSDMYAVEASASIADNEGNLLFYTDGFDVWNTNNQLMPNGTGFASATSPTQVVIIPFPNNANKYYIFHFTCPDPGICVPPTGLNYSVVDMELNGGLGDIDPTQREIPVIEETLSEKVMAVKQGNGTDWWVVTHDMDSTFIIVPVTADGVGTPLSQTIGNAFTNMSGEMEISPDGEKLVAVDIQGFINLFDFDRCEGILSNHLDFSKEFNFPDNSFYGCAFSPNSRVLYVTEYYKNIILQYDLNASDIAASETIVYDTGLSSGMGAMQLGPDRKLYFGIINIGLGVIENPDIIGTDCNAIQTSLFSSNVLPLPTFPNYNLEAIACETSSITLSNTKEQLEVYPNPFQDHTTIKWEGIEPTRMELWDVNGRLIESIQLAGFQNQYELNRSNLPGGYFVVKCIGHNGILGSIGVYISD